MPPRTNSQVQRGMGLATLDKARERLKGQQGHRAKDYPQSKVYTPLGLLLHPGPWCPLLDTQRLCQTPF